MSKQSLFSISSITVICVTILSACSSFMPIGPGINEPVQTSDEWEITVFDSYQGLKLGYSPHITLADGYSYITLEACTKNLSGIERAILWDDISIVLEDGTELLPVGQGYRQSEVFAWLLPIFAPFGAKRIVDDLTFVPVQAYELFSLPAHESQGCKDSYRLTAYAFLFTVETEMLDKPFTLHFFDKELTLEARKPIVIPRSTVRWIKRLGWAFLLSLGILFWVRRRRQKRDKMIEAAPPAIPPSEEAGQ